MYKPRDLAIYIHWPFCKSKCPYCDFYKKTANLCDEETLIDEYLKALRHYHEILPDREIKSVFFGGGTPSLIKPANIAKITDFIYKQWPVAVNVEISLEANPNTNRKNMFADLKNAGINRLSLGVQALNDADLRFLGRTHDLQTARQCLEEIVQIFDNHSADLIYARPRQTMDEWQKELQEICSYGLKHLSLYQLTIEENTVFYRKNIKPLPDDEAADLYLFTKKYLAGCGYPLYEVSNFARPDFQSRHNLTYWQGGDYIGIGQSAQGRLTLDNKFYAVDYPFHNEELSVNERAEELILTGLRLASGIQKKTFQNIIGRPLSEFISQPALTELQALNLISETDDSLTAADKGFLLLNTLIEKLCR
ncbi:MAG: radical SAM family heme chaperone HemW [Pseudomonadota bacterium]|nr:radical SAM family heme chaperone HemW [Pseudomonadota bacterium]